MRLDQCSPGDVLLTWHDTGAMGSKQIYVRVLKVGKAMLTVQSEYSDKPQRAYPVIFTSKVRPGGWFPDALALCVAPGQHPAFPFVARGDE